MRLPTLDEFIAQGPNKWPTNSYVTETGFASLYVRWGHHFIPGGELLSCLDLANAEAKEPGKGALKTLIAKLRREHPTINIYVESVLNPLLLPGLLRLGFIEVAESMPPCFFLRGASCPT
jgi:hypothetical protein